MKKITLLTAISVSVALFSGFNSDAAEVIGKLDQLMSSGSAAAEKGMNLFSGFKKKAADTKKQVAQSNDEISKLKGMTANIQKATQKGDVAAKLEDQLKQQQAAIAQLQAQQQAQMKAMQEQLNQQKILANEAKKKEFEAQKANENIAKMKALLGAKSLITQPAKVLPIK